MNPLLDFLPFPTPATFPALLLGVYRSEFLEAMHQIGTVSMKLAIRSADKEVFFVGGKDGCFFEFERWEGMNVEIVCRRYDTEGQPIPGTLKETRHFAICKKCGAIFKNTDGKWERLDEKECEFCHDPIPF